MGFDVPEAPAMIDAHVCRPIRIAASDHVSFADLDLPTAEVWAQSTAGTPYRRTVRYGMPKVPREFLKTTVFLYQNIDDAQRGKAAGGTAFLVSIPSTEENVHFPYFVTNWHNLTAGRGAPVVRVNTKDGGIDIFDYDHTEWLFLPEYDIAVIPAFLEPSKHDVKFIPITMFLINEVREAEEIGPGDDVFMIGRFVDHDGVSTNTPALRFGHISVDPAPIRQPNGKVTDCYCIDMHSRTGYSGSPVFVYRVPANNLEPQSKNTPNTTLDILNRKNHLSLLGIHFGQFPERWEVTKDGGIRQEAKDASLLTGKNYIEGLSGMTCVLPAWKIWEVLNMSKLREQRDEANASLERDGGPVPETMQQDSEERSSGDKLLRITLTTPPKFQ